MCTDINTLCNLVAAEDILNLQDRERHSFTLGMLVRITVIEFTYCILYRETYIDTLGCKYVYALMNKVNTPITISETLGHTALLHACDYSQLIYIVY